MTPSSRKPTGTEFATQRRALAAFIGRLAEIAPNTNQTITPESRLIGDLGFDAIAFGRLGLLMAERYGIGGVSTETLRSENLTVEAFFEQCVLRARGLNPERQLIQSE